MGMFSVWRMLPADSRRARISTTVTQGVYFVSDGGSSNPDEDYHRPRRASQYIVPRSDGRRDMPITPLTPRGFRFSAVNDRVEALARVANGIEAEGDQATVYSLDEVDLTEGVRAELNESSGSTYLPIKSHWVR